MPVKHEDLILISSTNIKNLSTVLPACNSIGRKDAEIGRSLGSLAYTNLLGKLKASERLCLKK